VPLSTSSAPADPAPLAVLFHHRWTVPLLDELGRGGGSGRFVTLAHRLGAAPESLRRTLAAALARGYVVRNPGHGHPLRPDYLLSPLGEDLAPACGELLGALGGLELVGLGLRKWSMPVVFALDADGRSAPRGFAELRAALPLVTPRALSLALGALYEQALVERAAARYRIGSRAGPLRPPLQTLAQLVRAA
jgi:DNA-binding HxlR family transcriptional regulator